MGSPLASSLLEWYKTNARELPWRGSQDAYAVWVSEIMLQQTRIETVIPYYQRWMERFPTILTLAAASPQDVLSVWEGLGYYSRAHNLHHAAKLVVEKYAGNLPPNLEALCKLPGIGRYTAGAIASIAFGIDAPVLDGNVRRVLARLFDLDKPVSLPSSEKLLWELASKHLPAGQAGDYNQALMDLGATICTPRTPNCPNCPLINLCLAYERGVQEARPVVIKKTPIPHYTVTAAVIEQHKQVLIAQRPYGGLLGGLWEFPGGKLQDDEELEACLQREIDEELGISIEIGNSLGVYRHAYTHFRVTLHAFCCRLANGDQPKALQAQELRWVDPEMLSRYPMGKIDRQIASHLLEKKVCS
jgi:A/G-specific adenine glycosylase